MDPNTKRRGGAAKGGRTRRSRAVMLCYDVTGEDWRDQPWTARGTLASYVKLLFQRAWNGASDDRPAIQGQGRYVIVAVAVFAPTQAIDANSMTHGLKAVLHEAARTS